MPRSTPSKPVSLRCRLGAYVIDLIVMSSPLAAFFGLSERGNWGAFFGLVYGVGGAVPLFLVLQGASLFRCGRTLGMAYFRLELRPNHSFGKSQPFGLAFFSALQLLVASAVFVQISSVGHYSLSESRAAWVASAVFGLVVLAPNLLSIVLPGHRSLAERLCKSRSVESHSVPAGIVRARVRWRGYAVDVLLFALSLVPCWLVASSGEEAALLPAVFMCGALLVFQLWAWFSTRETIGARAFCSVSLAPPET